MPSTYHAQNSVNLAKQMLRIAITCKKCKYFPIDFLTIYRIMTKETGKEPDNLFQQWSSDSETDGFYLIYDISTAQGKASYYIDLHIYHVSSSK